ncbi:MAG: hypothetical protein KGS72_22380 [Cyanobacteria bacterium REEB67]|nr:hypothetical protein [Cyanobacteria bacterium REEB67]
MRHFIDFFQCSTRGCFTVPSSLKAFNLLVRTTSLALGLSGMLGLMAVDAGRCQDNQSKEEKSMLGPGARLQEYDEIVSPDMEHASTVAERARVALKNGNVSRAVVLAKRALKMDDDDIDIHFIYAAALEAKLERQAEKDPEMYKTCVHEWLIVYRNEVGDEKGMTYKGLNVLGTWWNDDARGGTAKKHLKKLVGYVPKAWETDNRFMARVNKPAEATVSGKLSAKQEGRSVRGDEP